MGEGEFHLVVYAWIRGGDGRYLLTKRSPNKGYPNMWECTGGSALAGDDSLTAALREVREETGLRLDPMRGRRVTSHKVTGRCSRGRTRYLSCSARAEWRPRAALSWRSC